MVERESCSNNHSSVRPRWFLVALQSDGIHDAMGFLHLGLNVSAFCKEIEALNEEYFDKLGCKAVRAEFGKGCKAMTVYTKEVWDAKPE